MEYIKTYEGLFNIFKNKGKNKYIVLLWNDKNNNDIKYIFGEIYDYNKKNKIYHIKILHYLSKNKVPIVNRINALYYISVFIPENEMNIIYTSNEYKSAASEYGYNILDYPYNEWSKNIEYCVLLWTGSDSINDNHTPALIFGKKLKNYVFEEYKIIDCVFKNVDRNNTKIKNESLLLNALQRSVFLFSFDKELVEEHYNRLLKTSPYREWEIERKIKKYNI